MTDSDKLKALEELREKFNTKESDFVSDLDWDDEDSDSDWDDEEDCGPHEGTIEALANLRRKLDGMA